MSAFTGIVYKWKKAFLGIGSAFWKEYRLSLDQKGWIVWSKVTGEIKAVARLHVVFPRIRCQPIDQNDERMNESVVKLAPYTLVIPMKLQFAGGSIEDVEFAVRNLDDLQMWMTTFAAGVGASQQFEQIEQSQRTNFIGTPDLIRSYPMGNRFNYVNRYGYTPDYYPTLWTSFQTCSFHHSPWNNPNCFNADESWYYSGPSVFNTGATFGRGIGTFDDSGQNRVDTFDDSGQRHDYSSGGDTHSTAPYDDGSFSYGGDQRAGDRDTFSYGGGDDHGSTQDHGTFSYGGDISTGDQGTFSDNTTDQGTFSYGGDQHETTHDDGGSFSYGGDTGGTDTGGNDGGFSAANDSGGGGSADTGGGSSDTGGGGSVDTGGGDNTQ